VNYFEPAPCEAGAVWAIETPVIEKKTIAKYNNFLLNLMNFHFERGRINFTKQHFSASLKQRAN
jgi:hypothetical protein